VLFLLPIVIKGAGAVVFNATIEHEKFLCETLDESPSSSYSERLKASEAARKDLYVLMTDYENPSAEKTLKVTKRLADARAATLASIIAQEPRIRAALAIEDAQLRQEALKKISETVWAPYLSSAKEVSKKAESGIPATIGILNAQKAALPDLIKEEIEKISAAGKLSFGQKSGLRRALTELPQDTLSALTDPLTLQNKAYVTLRGGIRELLGPMNAAAKKNEKLLRNRYGQTRVNLAEDVLEHDILNITIQILDAEGRQISTRVSSLEYFKGTPVEAMILYCRDNFTAMLQPYWTIYLGFFFDEPYDSNIFGGIWPMILGTFYLTAGAMIIAAPLGIIAAIYFAEYAGQSKFIEVLRMCVGTLAGVPSIVFGLFGLAFLINTVKISDNKSVLAGSVTLALLVLPTIIRSCEEALKSVPHSYREAALGLGAGKWRSIMGVILPAALPSMLTGIIISMGRAAGETAPIIFTAATSTGAALAVWEVFTQPTPALPWNIYNMCSEHEMADKVVHVQYGMVLTLLGIVLTLNFAAILIRAKLQKKLKS